ncbi:Adipocyte plasma membrane-associated protein [Orchesella cincta]|uniref:Adipocyte plasma membrane-associated protein n=1 Tax=Orchesella cincta TaxID=48709 RepID=A0A1D2N0R8_ORCCI|nr:Adipocyte plasma membrane-associated protein [Orchesella cincta]
MGFSCGKLLLRFLVVIGVFVTLLLVLPGLPPDQEFTEFKIEPPKKLEGWMANNTILDQAELYFEGPFGGIESVVVLDDNNIITGDTSGAVFRITGKNKSENIANLKFPCSIEENSIEADKKCGWPLGMRMDNDGNLLVMDYYGGMTRVNIKTGAYENLIPKRVPIKGKIGYTPEDVQMSKDGMIYWTDGNTNTGGDFGEELMGQPSGRLLKYDPVKKTNEVLLNDLHFSNGLCISDDEGIILVAEYGSAKLRRYYLRGEKRGQSDTFINGLPGYPDNIRPNGRGGYYVGLFQPWNNESSVGNHVLTPYRLARKLVFRIRFLLLTFLHQMQTLFPDNTHLMELETYVKNFGPLLNALGGSKLAIVVEISKDGKIIGVFYGQEGDMYGLSQLSLGKEYAYMVGPFHNKVWRIKKEALKSD